MSMECTTFRSHQSGALLGFFDLWVPKMGLEFKGCTLYQKNGRKWISLPTREYKGDDGEKKYVPVVRFREKGHADAFCTLAITAIDEFCAKQNEQPEQSTEVVGELPF